MASSLLGLVAKDPLELKSALIELSQSEEIEDQALLRSILFKYW